MVPLVFRGDDAEDSGFTFEQRLTIKGTVHIWLSAGPFKVKHDQKFSAKVDIRGSTRLQPGPGWTIDAETTLGASWVGVRTVEVMGIKVKLDEPALKLIQPALDKQAQKIDEALKDQLRIPWHLRDLCPDAKPPPP